MVGAHVCIQDCAFFQPLVLVSHILRQLQRELCCSSGRVGSIEGLPGAWIWPPEQEVGDVGTEPVTNHS